MCQGGDRRCGTRWKDAKRVSEISGIPFALITPMLRTQSRGTALSAHAAVLRSTLLLSLGLSPLGCGGTVVSSSDSQGGSVDAGGAGPIGGANPTGGTSPTGGTGPTMVCANPMVDPLTLFISCDHGLVHRAEARVCTFAPPQGAGGAAGAGGGGSGVAGAGAVFSPCTADAECAFLSYGYCDKKVLFGSPRCRSGCSTDSECDYGGVCACSDTGVVPGVCISATCRVDADCATGSMCAQWIEPCGTVMFTCTSPEDECRSSRDCGGGLQCYGPGDHLACVSVACGRPFLIAEEPRMAAIETRADWLDATLTPNLSGLTPVQRAELAAHWAHLGQMEHASIAAFARFQLQLLSLGAPSNLVEACNRALADETAHTRACFALASSYGGVAVGPARLHIEHCFEDTSLSAIAKLVLREGCIGETAAALEALSAAEAASDPAVRRALTGIARDELRHAALAFEFLRWALAQSSDEARHELARESARQLADFERAGREVGNTITDSALTAHGLLAGNALRATHRAAVREVTQPLLTALFGAEPGRAIDAPEGCAGLCQGELDSQRNIR